MVNPDKIWALTQMQPEQNRKDVQKLIGRIESLNRFVSKLAKRNLPFLAVLRSSGKVHWGVEQKRPSMI
jgi:hypothetical protein